jgi:hypothetical protein
MELAHPAPSLGSEELRQQASSVAHHDYKLDMYLYHTTRNIYILRHCSILAEDVRDRHLS